MEGGPTGRLTQQYKQEMEMTWVKKTVSDKMRAIDSLYIFQIELNFPIGL